MIGRFRLRRGRCLWGLAGVDLQAFRRSSFRSLPRPTPRRAAERVPAQQERACLDGRTDRGECLRGCVSRRVDHVVFERPVRGELLPHREDRRLVDECIRKWCSIHGPTMPSTTTTNPGTKQRPPQRP